MKLGIKRLTTSATMPAYQTAGASGIDLHSDETLVIPAGNVARIGCGIALQIPDGYEGQVRPRSGLSLGCIVAVFGTIDRDYTGEVRVVLANESRHDFRVNEGDRIAQLVIAPVARCEIVEVERLAKTARGANGFGSTGVRVDEARLVNGAGAGCVETSAEGCGCGVVEFVHQKHGWDADGAPVADGVG